MSGEEPDVCELARRFIAQRRELGDILWPRVERTRDEPNELVPADEPATAASLARHERPAERQTSSAAGPPRPMGRPQAIAPPAPPPGRRPELPEPGIVVPPPQPSLLRDQAEERAWEGLTLEEFGKQISRCRRCPLWESRRNFVFGEGSPNAQIIFIGEAPGEEEDLQGRPFVGRAGQLLTRMIGAMKLRREDVYIANVLKSRPPNNRSPLPSEIDACMPYLEHQIRLIRPKLVCALGRVAAQALLRTSESLSRLRGRWHSCYGVKTMVTYHPAALLRNPNWKPEAWDDLKKLRKELDGVEL